MNVTTPQGITHQARTSRRPGFIVLECSGRAMDATRLLPVALPVTCKTCQKLAAV